MIKTISYKSQIGVYSFRNMKTCTSFGREGSSSIFSSINITSKVAQYMTMYEITNDIHIALDTSDMLQSAHVIMVRWWLQKNRLGTSSSVTTTLNRLYTMSHGPYYAIHIYIYRMTAIKQALLGKDQRVDTHWFLCYCGAIFSER